MSLPKVSVMIATYNQEKYIAQAVESALAQDYSNLEIVVADDNSKDATFKTAGEYEKKDGRLKVFENKKNLGRVGNYRKLVYEYATGDWCVMLDGDDYFIDKSFISSCVDKIEGDKEIVAVLGGYIRDEENRKLKFSFVPKEGSYNGLDIFKKFPGVIFGHGAFFYNRNIALNINVYEKDIIGSDTEAFLKLILHGKVYQLEKATYVWRIHGENTMIKTDYKQGIKNLEILSNSVSDHARNMQIDKKTIKRQYDRIYTKQLRLLIFSCVGNRKLVGKLTVYLIKKSLFVFKNIEIFFAILMALILPKKIFFVMGSLYMYFYKKFMPYQTRYIRYK